MHKTLIGLLLIWPIMHAQATDVPNIDWNDSKLDWHSYEKGMDLIRSTKKKGLLIIYADWCPTCKAYSHLFAREDVVKSLEGLILIRVDKDQQPEINEKYAFDGEYVPRTIALDNEGEVIQSLYPKGERYTYFIPVEDPYYLIEIVGLMKKKN